MTLNIVSYKDQEDILGRLSFLCEDMERKAEVLQRFGYTSFLAWSEFEEGCCANEAELAILPKFQVERAKAFFCRPDGFLGKERDDYLNSIAPWGRRFDGKNQEEWARFLSLRGDRSDRFKKYRNDERGRLIFWEDTSVENDRSFCRYFQRLLINSFESLGFELDSFRSREDFPVIRKRLAFGWDVCWSADSNRVLATWPRSRSDFLERWSTIDLRCYVRSPKGRGFPLTPIGFSGLNFINLRIDQMVSGFGWAYSRVNGAEEVKLSLDAHACLYKEIAPQLEGWLDSEFKSRG